MSLSHQTQQRLPHIKAGLLRGDSYTTIGHACGVTDKTIDRDMHAFVTSDAFWTWIKEEYLRLHAVVVHENPTAALTNLSRLVAKMIPQRLEAHTVEELKIDEQHVTIIADYTSAIESAAKRDLQALRAEQQMDTTDASTTTT
jgi:hypothetical protein